MSGTVLCVPIAAVLLAVDTVTAAQAADLQPYAKKGQVFRLLALLSVARHPTRLSLTQV